MWAELVGMRRNGGVCGKVIAYELTLGAFFEVIRANSARITGECDAALLNECRQQRGQECESHDSRRWAPNAAV